LTGGASQTGTVNTTLATPIQMHLGDPYGATGYPGITVTFSDGGKGGVFTPASAVTDSNGLVSSTYTLPKKSGTYTLTMSSSNYGTATTTATALPGAAVKVITWSGAKQTGSPGSVLPNPVVVQVRDIYANGVPGVTVNFSASSGSVSPTSIATDSKGKASTIYTLPNAVGTFYVNASSPGLNTVKVPEYSQ